MLSLSKFYIMLDGSLQYMGKLHKISKCLVRKMQLQINWGKRSNKDMTVNSFPVYENIISH